MTEQRGIRVCLRAEDGSRIPVDGLLGQVLIAMMDAAARLPVEPDGRVIHELSGRGARPTARSGTTGSPGS
jgi:hypothetical protein